MSGAWHPKLTAVLIVVSFAIGASILEGAGLHSAFAMGQSPASCSNLYDGDITSLAITYPSSAGPKTFDPFASPNGTFTLNNGQSYQVAMVLHSANLSTGQNTANGSVWYSSNWQGSGFGVCVLKAHANENILVNVNVTKAPNLNPVGNNTQPVSWTSSKDTVLYNVIWVQPSATTSTGIGTTTTTTGSAVPSTTLPTTTTSAITLTPTVAVTDSTSSGSTTPAPMLDSSSSSSSSDTIAASSSTPGSRTSGGYSTLLIGGIAGAVFLVIVGYYALRRSRW